MYIGRQTHNGNASVVKGTYDVFIIIMQVIAKWHTFAGSVYEWDFIHIHLRQLLDEIHCHPKPGAAFGDLVPMLAKREGATQTLTKENKMTFFEDAQVKQPSVLAKFVFSPIQGQYALYVRTPVNDDVSENSFLSSTFFCMHKLMFLIICNPGEGETEVAGTNSLLHAE